jgi:death-on-curing protein
MDIKDPGVIIRLHDALVEEFGGEKGLLSENLLFSAISRPFVGLKDGKELYPTIERKAAALMHSMVKNHPFIDGNKRTASNVTLIFLRENGYSLNFTDNEIIEFVLNIA